MCAPIMPPKRGQSQPPDYPPEPTPLAPDDGLIEGFPGHLPRAGGRDGRAERADAGARAWASQEWGILSQRVNSVELGPTRTPGFWDRRVADRVQGLALPAKYRLIAQRQGAVAASCRSGVRAFRGWEPGPGNGVDLRQVVEMSCGTRRCEHCQKEIRRRACGRMAINASLFFTFTTPPDIFGIVEAWEECHPSLRQFIAIIRRENAYRHRKITGKRKCDRTKQRKRRSLANSRIRGGFDFEYAWAKEPHGSGRPHVHMIVSFTWVDFAWIREVWARVNGALDANFDGRKVKSVEGACHYLSTYVAKQITTPDILAIVKSKRMWASTKHDTVQHKIRWVHEVGCSENRARDSINARAIWGIDKGWSVECGNDNVYARWKRPTRLPGPVDLELFWSEPGIVPGASAGRKTYVNGYVPEWISYCEDSKRLAEMDRHSKLRAKIEIAP